MSLDSELFNLMRPLRGSLNCFGNGIRHICRTMRNSFRRSPNHFVFCVRMITHHRRSNTRSQNSYRQVEDRMYDRLDTGRSIADSIYVAGYAPNDRTILNSQTSAPYRHDRWPPLAFLSGFDRTTHATTASNAWDICGNEWVNADAIRVGIDQSEFG
jgi:hypothetical protein